ncbi:tryptophan decarboxylase 1-like [Dioscorea cayenensis subsp. rotundata]|uniref:Tryptophan decarboxylase 1-like n=1 Tax=Dioscorea cayennensis subsp. rotundata TaxID=55577 RepID=A0AB40B3R2_DIOCR|nr:tryptophan decarboxylase 1-like [Dioscorea cayenensis subsp. rotundata]
MVLLGRVRSMLLRQRPPVLMLRFSISDIGDLRLRFPFLGFLIRMKKILHFPMENSTLKPMDSEQLREYGHQMVDFIADYYKTIESFPVRSQVKMSMMRIKTRVSKRTVA